MYEKLDSLIVIAVGLGSSPLYNRTVCDEADIIAKKYDRQRFRVIDARIQNLRTHNVIEFCGSGPDRKWRVVT